MSAPDTRQLLNIKPEFEGRLACGLVLSMTLHRSQTAAFGDVRDDIEREREQMLSEASARLGRVSNLFVEAGTGAPMRHVSVLWQDPCNLGERIALVNAIINSLGADSPWRLDAWALAPWALAALPESFSHSRLGFGRGAPFDLALAIERKRASVVLLAPWLDGRVAVRNLDAFAEFHRGLGAASQELFRLVSNAGRLGRSFRLADPRLAPEMAWAHSAIADLVTNDWLSATPSPAAQDILLKIESRGRQLSFAELLL